MQMGAMVAQDELVDATAAAVIVVTSARAARAADFFFDFLVTLAVAASLLVCCSLPEGLSGCARKFSCCVTSWRLRSKGGALGLLVCNRWHIRWATIAMSLRGDPGGGGRT